MSDYETRTRAEVAEWPGASVTFDKRAKHRAAVVAFGGATRFVIFSDTPSDEMRGVHNHLATLRRELAGMGAKRDRQLRTRRPRKARNPGAARRQTITHDPAPPRPDPWAPLRALARQEAPPRLEVAPAPPSPRSGRLRALLAALAAVLKPVLRRKCQ